VVLHATTGLLTIEDWIDAAEPHEMILSFHFGPLIQATLDRGIGYLEWNVPDSTTGEAQINLPSELRWTRHCGETAPPLGWYSRGFGQREPAVTLVGRGVLAPRLRLLTHLCLGSPPATPAQNHEEACPALPPES
jgi:hypothetical protein